MTTLQPEEKKELKPRITVIGVGGAGSNAVNNMIRGELKGVKFISSNTDPQIIEIFSLIIYQIIVEQFISN